MANNTTYIVTLETATGTEFLVSSGGRWSNEYPDAMLFTYAEARELACKFKADFGKAAEYAAA